MRSCLTLLALCVGLCLENVAAQGEAVEQAIPNRPPPLAKGEFVASKRWISQHQRIEEKESKFRWWLKPFGRSDISEIIPTTYWVGSNSDRYKTLESRYVSQDEWCGQVLRAADAASGRDPVRRVLIFIHGYNNKEDEVARRARSLASEMKRAGFKGVVVSYDWFSNGKFYEYASDRERARASALDLINDCVLPLKRYSTSDQPVEVSVLAHSTGAFLTREAFRQLGNRPDLKTSEAHLSHVAFVAGDVTRKILGMVHQPSLKPVIDRCGRLTNYFNDEDNALAASQAIRFGLATRVGEEGLPRSLRSTCDDIDCSWYYQSPNYVVNKVSYMGKPEEAMRSESHSWFFRDPTFAADLTNVLHNLASEQTRQPTENGTDKLQPDQVSRPATDCLAFTAGQTAPWRPVIEGQL